MNLDQYKNIYFVGIGGIGMSALSRYFNEKVNVLGYDKVQSDLCLQLESENIDIHYLDSEQNIPNQIKESREETLVVYTPAIPEENKELSYFRNNGYVVVKRSELLGKITENHFTIAVAGTHGKTTTSTMITHILHHSEVDCTAFLGGISRNYNSNLILGTEKSIVVVEADEYDRSFLTLNPDIAVITSVDADHLDIYKTKESLINAFTDFTNKIKSGGTLFLEENIDTTLITREDISILQYSTSDNSDCRALHILHEDYSMKFDVLFKEELLSSFKLCMGGEYNVHNALVAISVSKLLDIDNQRIIESINTFKGIYRRFETHLSSEKVVFIDDYAHHPIEVKESLLAVKKMYPNRHITVIFQPHLYSRTNDFSDEFAIALSLSDRLIILEIYAAREKSIEGVSSEMLLNKCTVDDKKLSKLSAVVDCIEDKDIDVLLTLGAGDISTIVNPLKSILS